ncbi:chloride channel protein [Siphonobacter curvatus]|uniref:Chloride channel protein n=1 Tax=Siphonobacter curvatus TaxID=2094562 RepID=A0A2S7IJU6_9BACT|nr:chloride channel protein [Siphonobacter curvatus]
MMMRGKYHLNEWEIRLRKYLKRVSRSTGVQKINHWLIAHNLSTAPLRAAPLWIASVLVGLMAVGYEKVFAFVEHTGMHWYQNHPYLIFLTTPLCFCGAWLLTHYLAPTASGSGIPQLMAAVDLAETKAHWKVDKLLSLRIALVKVASNLVLLLGGGATGREGPTLQIAGSIFETIYRLVPETWNKVSQRVMIVTGGAAGLAAAFNTPLGGIVYVVEELTKAHLAVFRTAVLSSVIIAGITSQFLLGPYLFLGFPKITRLPLESIWLVIGIAFVTGLAGSAFTKLLLLISSLRKRFPGLTRQLVFVTGLGLLFATIVFFSGVQAMGSGKELINQALFEGTEHIAWYAFPVRFIGNALSFSAGGAAGIFATSLSSGAMLSSLLLEYVIPVQAQHHNLLILVGMIGFLTGVTRTPFTSAILVLEMTDRHSAIFYFLLAGIIANVAASLILRHSFYEIRKEEFLTQPA